MSTGSMIGITPNGRGDAKLLREGRLQEVDLDHVAEEIEDMGKSQRHNCGAGHPGSGAPAQAQADLGPCVKITSADGADPSAGNKPRSRSSCRIAPVCKAN